MNCTHAALSHMVDQESGCIINYASDSYKGNDPSLAVYGGAKAGNVAFTKNVAKEVGEHGIRMNVVSPGTTETPATEEWLAEYREKVLESYALNRLGKPQDIANTVAFLASDAAEWITAEVVSVNGGYIRGYSSAGSCVPSRSGQLTRQRPTMVMSAVDGVFRRDERRSIPKRYMSVCECQSSHCDRTKPIVAEAFPDTHTKSNDIEYHTQSMTYESIHGSVSELYDRDRCWDELVTVGDRESVNIAEEALGRHGDSHETGLRLRDFETGANERRTRLRSSTLPLTGSRPISKRPSARVTGLLRCFPRR